MIQEEIKVGDIVEFNPYPEEVDRVPSYGKVNRIGSQIELQIGWREDDDRTFYELVMIYADGTCGEVFTKTTRQWLKKVDLDLDKLKNFHTFE
jgi:hypothetical protein